MIGRWCRIGGSVLACGLLAAVGPGGAGEGKGPVSPIPLARVGDEVISREEVERALQVPLAQLEYRRQALVDEGLERLIGDRLLAREATQRGLTVEALLKAEVDAAVPEATEAEVTAFMARYRARLPQGNEAELRPRVRDYLRAQRVNRERQAYIRRLRAQANVTVDGEELATLRLQVSPDKGFARGPAAAPVVLVEFADFQCLPCKTVLPTVQQLLAQYPGKVKWVFRDFPIPGLHPAHEAARCAADQGRFWEYHDLLYARSPHHSAEELKAYARELKLEEEAFARCVEGGTYRAAVNADVQEGLRLGVFATPAFFINGRAVVGIQPLSRFRTLVEAELAKQAGSTAWPASSQEESTLHRGLRHRAGAPARPGIRTWRMAIDW